MSVPKKTLDFGLLQEPLDTVLLALENKVEREWPQNLARIAGAREVFLVMLKMGRITFKTVRWIAADTPRDVFRKPEYVLPIPALNRVLLDMLFSVVFILEDLRTRIDWFQKSGWRELAEEYSRYLLKYSGLSHWQDWLGRVGELVEQGKQQFNITAEEAANPSLITYWPIPKRMIRFGFDPPREGPLTRERDFLQYLNDWFYRELSSFSHLSGAALFKVGSFVLTGILPESLREQVENEGFATIRGTNVGRTVTLELALASEVEAYFAFGLSARLKYVWSVLADHSEEPQEIYEYRYKELLP